MDWLILLLLVPAIIIPIVMLWGFVGCAEFGSADSPSLPSPTNLRAKGEGIDLIKLNWQHSSATPVAFKVMRLEEGSSSPITYDNLAGLAFDDKTSLIEGTTYFYKVRAVSAGVESGDSNESSATAFPKAPSNLAAIPQDVNRIDLTWTNNSSKAEGFIILDKSLPAAIVPEIKIPMASAATHQLTVPEGSEHEFQIFAFVNGPQENIQQEVRSLPSNQVIAKPLAFKAVFTNEQQLNIRGECLVQRISSALLKNKGAKIKITVRSPANLVIDRIYISQPAASGNPWDSHTDLTKVVNVDLGDPAVTLPANSSKTLGPVNYNLDPSKDLLVAFDISSNAGQGGSGHIGLTGSVAYRNANTQQAAVANRDAGYNTQNRHYLIEKIEVS